MLSTRDKRCSSNPAGFLVNAIENDYQKPKGFMKSREEAKSELKVLVGGQRTRIEEPVVEKAPEPTAEEVEFDSWWATLNKEEQDQFETEAAQKTNSFQRKFYNDGKEKGGAIYKTIRRTILLEAFNELKSK
jgi:hypothetical protein